MSLQEAEQVLPRNDMGSHLSYGVDPAECSHKYVAINNSHIKQVY